MITKTNLAKSIDAAGEATQYDDACKRVLAEKIILAWIMKNCLEEYQGIDVKEIAEKYIEGKPQVAETTVLPDEVNPPLIKGTGVEDTSINEQTITYDIKFSAIAPDSGDAVELIINVEAQNDFYPGYPLIKRAVYYCSRMISSQYGTEFTNSHYEKIKKVYSIWICINPPKYRQNTITKYSITEQSILGNAKEKNENYDLLSIIMICLGEHFAKADAALTPADELIRLLDVLLSSNTTAEEKKHILEDEYSIPMTESFERLVNEMCNLSMGVEAKGIQKGIQKGILQSILNLMESMKWSAEQAMNALKIPPEEQTMYAAQIKENSHSKDV